MKKLVIALATALAVPAAATAQDPQSAALLAEQTERMKAFEWQEGLWRGDATFQTPNGPFEMVQVERVGPFLGGSVKIVEGRGYDKDTGEAVFNALGIIKWHNELGEYRFHTFAQGRSGVYPVELTETGYNWWIEAGPMTMRYETTFTDGVWHEVGYRIMGDAEPVQFFEMKLRRVGDNDWPGPVPMNVGQ
ncbi:DUF1579 domain-containing protein [Sphingomicrobium flavum]|uniref:DUF1579 domain-containing protein n=1 Tax=Sphingomicrobium flavum TaxID=1229164 RepID=UPI0021AE1F04|nr:DUF1579 domain-containing protein [Sphingomicrobium flavum]